MLSATEYFYACVFRSSFVAFRKAANQTSSHNRLRIQILHSFRPWSALSVMTGLSLRRSTRLRALQDTVTQAAEIISGGFQAEIMANFLQFIQQAHPMLRLLVAFAAPWTLLCITLSRSRLTTALIKAVRQALRRLRCASVVVEGGHPLHYHLLWYMTERGLGSGGRALTMSARRTMRSVMRAKTHDCCRISHKLVRTPSSMEVTV